MASSQNVSVFRQTLSRLGYLSSAKDENAPLDMEDKQAMQRALVDLAPIMNLDVSKGYTPAIGQSIVAAVAEKGADAKVIGALNAYAKRQGFDAEEFLSETAKKGLAGVRAAAALAGSSGPKTKFTYDELNGMLKNEQKFSDTLLQNIQGVRHLFEGNNARNFISAVNEVAPELARLEVVARPAAAAAVKTPASKPETGIKQPVTPEAGMMQSFSLDPVQYAELDPTALAAVRAAQNFNESALGGRAPVAKVQVVDVSYKLTDSTQQNSTQAAPAAKSAAAQTAGAAVKADVKFDPAVAEAQTLMKELSGLLDGKLKVDLATKRTPDGIDGIKGPKTNAAVIATRRFLADPVDPEKGEFDDSIDPVLLDVLRTKIKMLKAEATADVDAGAKTNVKTEGSAGEGSEPDAEGAAPDAAAGMTPAPAAPVVDPAVLAVASQTAEESLKKIADKLAGLYMPVAAPGPADGDFDAQSVKSGEEVLARLTGFLDIQNPGGKYSAAVGAQLRTKINGDPDIKKAVDDALGVGGFEKMMDAFDMLNKAGKFGLAPQLTKEFQGVTSNFPRPAINQQQANLLGWAVNRDKGLSTVTNELMRLYGGHGIEDMYPAQVPHLTGLKLTGKDMPPKEDHIGRVTHSFKEMLDSGMRFEDARKKIMENMEALFQAAGYPQRAGAFRTVLQRSFDAADAAINLGESNENIAKAFDKALEDNWRAPHAQYPTPFQPMVIHPSRQTTVAQSAFYAVPGEVARRKDTDSKMGYVDLFDAQQKREGKLFGVYDPLIFKDKNGNVQIVTLGPRTNLITVETISAKELAEMDAIVKNGHYTQINGQATQFGQEELGREYAVVRAALAERSAAYNVIRENHGAVVLGNDPRWFMKKLTEAKTLDELRVELGGMGRHAPAAAPLEAKNLGLAGNFGLQVQGAAPAAPPGPLPDEPGRKPGQQFGPQQ